MELKFDSFTRKPFTVDAIKVTDENMKEIAKLLGQVKKEPNGTRYIHVYKNKTRNVTKIYVGYWVTKMGNNFRAYSERVFNKEFVLNEESAVVNG